jgi:hypothetical protein
MSFSNVVQTTFKKSHRLLNKEVEQAKDKTKIQFGSRYFSIVSGFKGQVKVKRSNDKVVNEWNFKKIFLFINFAPDTK